MPKVIIYEGVPVVKCPGCKSWHRFNPPEKPFNGARWTWNGDREKPTFSPSMNVVSNPADNPHYVPGVPTERCHSFVQEGRIQFLSDSTHQLAGQTVDLPDWPEVDLAEEEKRGEGPRR